MNVDAKRVKQKKGVGFLTVATFFVGLIITISSNSFAVEFSDEEKGLLKKGKIVRKELPSSRNKGFYGGTGWCLIKAPTGVIWEAITDWKSYQKIFPHTEEMAEVSRRGDRLLMRIKMGHPILTIVNYLEMRMNKEKQVLSFKLVKSYPHDLDDIRGYWRLFPQKNGFTLVAYVIAVKAPMGLVNLAGPKLEREAIRGLLAVPGNIKTWIESTDGKLKE